MYEVYCGTERNPIEWVNAFADYETARDMADMLGNEGVTASVYHGTELMFAIYAGEEW